MPAATLPAASPETEVVVLPLTTPTTGVLLPQDRIARAPLASWAERLMGQLDGVAAETLLPRDRAAAVAAIANNAALIAAHRGDANGAWEQCELQIRWHARMAQRTGDEAITGNAVQPWINLGRLEALRGDWEAATARFAALAGYANDGVLVLCGVRVNGSGWEVAGPSPEHFSKFLENVYVIDTLKALLMSGQWDGVLDFSRGLREGGFGARLARYGDEAAVVAAARTGELERAHDTAARAMAETHGWDRFVFRLRLAEVLAAAGDDDAARALLLPMAEVMGKLSEATRGALQTLYVAQRVSTLCRDVGLTAASIALAKEVWHRASSADDEVFQIEALRLLTEVDEPARETWTAVLDRLERQTEYGRYRRDGGSTSSTAVTRLAERLTDFLAR